MKMNVSLYHGLFLRILDCLLDDNDDDDDDVDVDDIDVDDDDH